MSRNLSERQFGEYTLAYSTEDHGESRPRHVIEAYHPDAEEPVARMTWNSREIQRLDVEHAHRRRGIASAMWEMGQEARPRPRHSKDRTAMGDAWARKVGGALPRRSRS